MYKHQKILNYFSFALFFIGTPSTPIMPGGTPGTPSSKTKAGSRFVEINKFLIFYLEFLKNLLFFFVL